jgi:hypothetical protein
LFRLARSTVAVCRAVHLGLLGLVLGFPLILCGQEAKPAAPAQTPAADSATAPTVVESWDSLLQGAIPQATPDPALNPQQVGGQKKAADDFANHFFFESRTDYYRYDTSFTGLPTNTGIINGPASNVFNPAGYPYAPDFQPDANRIESLIDFGTRGWLSDRVNTHFALRYEQDLSHVDEGSPAENVIETFGANRRFELLDANVEIDGKLTDGIFAGTSLTLGRQSVYGAELAEIDGAAFTVDRPDYTVTVFGGRRFSFFTDPEQRAMGGANVIFKIDPNTSLEYEGIWYLRGSNSAIFRRRINPHWLFSTNFRAYGGSPVDFGTQGLYDSGNGKTSLQLSFFQKLTNKDYEYDFTTAATDLDPHNPLLRLYLGPINPYTQFIIHARRTISSKFRLGGSVWVRRLDSKKDEGPFDTSFEDYRINAQIFPVRKVETFFEYHQRNSDRLSPLNPTSFDDLSATGETSVKDLTGDIRRSFYEGRFSVNGGVYYRRISLQDRFYYLNGLHQSGFLAGAWWKMDQHSRLFVDYDLDNDFFLLSPDLKNSRALHLGVVWKY